MDESVAANIDSLWRKMVEYEHRVQELEERIAVLEAETPKSKTICPLCKQPQRFFTDHRNEPMVCVQERTEQVRVLSEKYRSEKMPLRFPDEVDESEYWSGKCGLPL